MARGALGWIISPAGADEFGPADPEPEVVGFYVNWDDASRASLRENLTVIDVLVPEWVHLASPAGDLSLGDQTRIEETLEIIAPVKAEMRILPLFTNYFDGTWQVDWLEQVLVDAELRNALVKRLLDYVETGEFAGVTLGLQGIRSEYGELYLAFASDLYDAFHENGLLVYHTLAMQDRAVDAQRLSEVTDSIIVFGEGEEWGQHQPGPLASQEWFEAGLERRAEEIPVEKLIVGLSNVARDWSVSGVETYAVQEAFSRARESSTAIRMDAASLNPTFDYADAAGAQHSVWLLDAVTAFNHWQAARRLPPKGVALWRLGTEDPSIWRLLENPNGARADRLLEINFSHQIERYGNGEVLRLTGVPENGSRVIEQGPSGQVVSETIQDFPRGFQITQWGADDQKLLALTFDDGPDPTYTPRVLDVLKTYDVPATFFMVGNQMLRYPEVLQRVLAEGHEIGSHTYSHANISRTGDDLLRLELNATQRVFESATGRNLVLFRAPYARDTNPDTVEELRPLKTISELGYLAVNMNIDSRDWWLPTADRIVEDTLAGVRSGTGNIILMHDGGGDRQLTVSALPEIIERARAEGFRFVAVSTLIGKTSDEVMPKGDNSATMHVLQMAGFGVVRELGRFFAIAFGAAVSLGIARSLILILLSFLRERRERASALVRRIRRLPPPPKLTVGVIVPGYNEEKVIVQTVRSLLTSTVADLQVLIVDDGSTDDTFRLCRTTFKGEKRVRVVTKTNGGKAAALNFGVERLPADIIIAIDADTIFMPDAVELMLEHFSDPKVAAVSGNAKVGNRVNLLTRWQALEYITAQNLDRRAFEHINCIAVVPGAIGAWRRELIIAAGGFTTDTLAEDADLTMRLLRQGHTVTYQDRAIALTEAPETVKQFNKQRFRWMYGTLQVAFKHLGAMRLRDSKAVGLVALPNTLLFQILFPLLAPLADIGALLSVAGLAWDFFSESTSMPVGEALIMLAIFSMFVFVDFLAAAASFYHERKEDWRLLLWLVPQRFFYRQLIYLVAIRAVLSALRGSAVGWGTLSRTASVTPPLQTSAPRSRVGP